MTGGGDGEARSSWRARYEASLAAERKRLAAVEDPMPGGLGDALFELAGSVLICGVLGACAAFIRWLADHHPLVAAVGLLPVVVLVALAGVLAMRSWARRRPLPTRGAGRVIVIAVAGVLFLIVYWFLACACW